MENKNFDFIIIARVRGHLCRAGNGAEAPAEPCADRGYGAGDLPPRLPGAHRRAVPSHCDPCAIVHGWAGRGRLLRWQAVPQRRGGRPCERLHRPQARDGLYPQADDIYLSFGASKTVHGLNNSRVDEIAYEASRYNIRLVPLPVRHLGTENAGPCWARCMTISSPKPTPPFWS